MPSRKSKLIRILKESFGGNAQTSIIACISPAENDSQETLKTLKWASKVRLIENKPVVNYFNKTMVTLLRQEIFDLQNENLAYRKCLKIENCIQTDCTLNQSQKLDKAVSTQEDQAPILLDLEKRNIQLENELQATIKALRDKDDNFYSVQSERDFYKINYEAAMDLLSECGIEFTPPEIKETSKKPERFQSSNCK